MSDKPISPLRQRMIDDMTARRFKEKVQKDYVRHVRTFAAFLGRSPDTATSEDLRRFQLHMAQQQISAGSINAAIAALATADVADGAKRARRLPCISMQHSYDFFTLIRRNPYGKFTDPGNSFAAS